MQSNVRLLAASFSVALLLFIHSFAFGQATVISDKDDYAPLSNAVFSGSGFAAFETVILKVKNLNQPCNTVSADSSYLPWTVVADQNGAFVTNWTVCNCDGDSLRLKATGQTSGLIAYAYFTDANLNSLSVGAASQSVNYGTAATVTYTVGVKATGSGSGPTNVTLSASGLPAGVTYSWSSSSSNFVAPNIINFTSAATINVILTLAVPNNTNVPASPAFTVTAIAGGASETDNGTLTINRKSVSGGVTANDKLYDGGTAATILTRTLSGLLFGDDVSLSGGAATFADKNIGTKTVTATGLTLSGAKAGNYTLSSTTATTSATITAKPLTPVFSIDDKVYDGNASATIANRQLTGIIANDKVTLTGGTANFSDKNVGANKNVTVSAPMGLTGSDAGNYSVGTVGATTASITVRTATINFTVSDRAYDGTTTAAITAANIPSAAVDPLRGLIAGDNVTVNYYSATAAFSNKDVAATQPQAVSASGFILTGPDGPAPGGNGNYQVSAASTFSSTANMSPLSISINFTASNKIYDGLTSAAILTRTLVGALAVDAGKVSGGQGTATYDTKNVGTGKIVTATGFVLTGSAKENYSLVPNSATTTADITTRGLTVTAQTDNRVYNGTTSSAVAPIVAALQTGDNIGTAPSQAYNNRNVGTGKTLIASGLVINDGNGGNNYSVTYVPNNTGIITARGLSVTAQTDNRVYNGTTSSTVAPVVPSLQAGDNITSAPTQVYDNRNVGTGKALTVSGLVINDGNGGNNYSVNYIPDNTGIITAREIDVTAQTDNRVYNGTTSSAVAPVVPSLQTGDNIATEPTQVYNNRNVGTGKILTASGLVINDGNGGNNYSVNYIPDNTGIITARGIDVTAQTDNRVYNGTTSSSVASLVDPLQPGDVIGTAPVQKYDTKNVGTNKTLTPSGLLINDGNGGLNYETHYVTNTTGVITALDITGSVTVANKVYDGNTSATIATRTLTGAIIGDYVTYSGGTATFDDIPVGTGKNVGNNKPVSVTGLSLSGGDKNNYTVNNSAVTTANITQAGLTITADNLTVQYSDPIVYTVKYEGFVGGDGTGSLGGGVTFSTTPAATTGTNPVIATGAPGTYAITPVGLTSSNYAITFKPGTLTINKEDAKITYTGSTLAATSGTATTATITLSATIQDITAVPVDPDYDVYPGDIRKATITFNIDGVDKATVPIGLVNSDTKTGTAIYNFAGAGLGDHTVLLKLNGYYAGCNTGDNQVVVEVYQSAGDFITGGGYLNLINSNGQKAGDAGTKNNFGFNIKYNKGGTNLQGTINTIVRRMEGGVLHVYQVKGNSMTSLVVNASAIPPTAVFNGKANITDITNPLSPVSLGGNSTLQVSMTDGGDPATADKIGITVYNNAGGVWFTSNWDGSKTVQQTLAGGNLIVHSSNNVSARTETVATDPVQSNPALSDHFAVKVLPTVSQDYFTVNVQSNTLEAFEIKVYDMYGKQIEMARGGIGQSVRIGHNWSSGIYILNVCQGAHMATIRVSKL